jgi:hypothetical protein
MFNVNKSKFPRAENSSNTHISILENMYDSEFFQYRDYRSRDLDDIKQDLIVELLHKSYDTNLENQKTGKIEIRGFMIKFFYTNNYVIKPLIYNGYNFKEDSEYLELIKEDQYNELYEVYRDLIDLAFYTVLPSTEVVEVLYNSNFRYNGSIQEHQKIYNLFQENVKKAYIKEEQLMLENQLKMSEKNSNIIKL